MSSSLGIYASQISGQLGVAVDLIVIAGGGGSGGRGGGGGAGGLVYFETNKVPLSSAITCTVGAGGAGDAGSAGVGSQGVNSSFGSLTPAVGGGYGADANIDGMRAGGGGGSGGGAGGGSGTGQPSGGSSTQGTTGVTAYYGNIGGKSCNKIYTDGGIVAGGGGGGAGGAGADGTGTGQYYTNQVGGNGGAGINTISSMTVGSLSTWLSVTGLGDSGYLASGGAGAGINSSIQNTYASASAGGGGYGPSNGNGLANTGGGGGSAGSNNSGGSGVIIMRYSTSVTCTIGTGLTGASYTSGGYKYTKLTAGTGTVTFS